MTIQELAPGVFTSDHRVVEGKNGIVLGSRLALAIDCGTDPDEGQAMADFIRGRGAEPNRLALTHSHADHALGSDAFRGAEVYAHARAAEGIRAQLTRAAVRAGATPEEMGKHLAWPTVTFTDELGLDLGGKTLRVLSTPGHSADSVCLFLEQDRILFGGDTVVTAIVPAFGGGDSRQMEASLRRLVALDAETLVPGHGPVLRGAAEVRDWLAWLADYIAGTREAVRRVISERAGAAQEDLVAGGLENAAFERHIGSRLDPERHGQRDRHRATISKLVAEETGGS